MEKVLSSKELTTKITEIEEKIEDLDVQDLMDKCSDAEDKASDAENKAEELETQLEDLNDRVYTLENIEDNGTVEKLKDDVSLLKVQLDALTLLVKAMLNSMSDNALAKIVSEKYNIK